jgi:two-component system response regulator FixJ
MSSVYAPKHLVAIVEDDAAVRDSLRFAMEADGYAVCLFETARDAIDSHSVMEADCLVIDHMLPDLDGLAMLRQLRRRGLACPAIIVAANPTTQCRQGAKRADAPLLVKPIIGADLSDLLREILRGPAGLAR